MMKLTQLERNKQQISTFFKNKQEKEERNRNSSSSCGNNHVIPVSTSRMMHFPPNNEDVRITTSTTFSYFFSKKVTISICVLVFLLLSSILISLINVQVKLNNMNYVLDKENGDDFDGKQNTSTTKTENIQVANYTSRREIKSGMVLRRSEWNARYPTQIIPLNNPVDMIIVCHTATQNCYTSIACTKLVRSIQRFHMDEKKWRDIGYNFVIGGDGRVYEGSGWTREGVHTAGFNKKSVGIAFTGNFSKKLPNESQLESFKELIKTGIQSGYVAESYKMYGASQLVSTLSPGAALMEELKNWEHFSTTNNFINNN